MMMMMIVCNRWTVSCRTSARDNESRSTWVSLSSSSRFAYRCWKSPWCALNVSQMQMVGTLFVINCQLNGKKFQSTRVTLTCCTTCYRHCVSWWPFHPVQSNRFFFFSSIIYSQDQVDIVMININFKRVQNNNKRYCLHNEWRVRCSIDIRTFFFSLLHSSRLAEKHFPCHSHAERERWQVVNPLSPCWPEMCLERTPSLLHSQWNLVNICVGISGWLCYWEGRER